MPMIQVLKFLITYKGNNFFHKLRTMTNANRSQISRFFQGGDTQALQDALTDFTKRYFSLLDEGTEPSLKSRLISLISGVNSIYKLEKASEYELDGGKFRIDLYYEPKNEDSGHIIIEVKSIPIYWLEPKQFKKTDLNDLEAKKEISTLLDAEHYTKEKILKCDLNQRMQKPPYWQRKYSTVQEYIEHGRRQTQNYMTAFNKEKSVPVRGYLVWGVGISKIYVEEISSRF